MVAIITVADLPAALQSAEMVDVMVAGANAKASRVAPCLASTDPAPTEDQIAEARLVLIGAVKRWAEAGSGALAQRNQQAGPFAFGETVDTRQRTGFNLWPSEIEALRDICSSSPVGREAFSIDTAPVRGSASAHLPWCDLNMGGTTCSCGADIAGYPLYEMG